MYGILLLSYLAKTKRKEPVDMKKYLALTLSLLMIALMPLTLASCGNKYDDADMELFEKYKAKSNKHLKLMEAHYGIQKNF